MSGGPFLQIDGLVKRFGDVTVLDDLSLDLAEGEILALLGLSGSGKTTALRLLAGFERPDGGTITVEGETLAGDGIVSQSPSARGFGMVFQHYALFPHMTVAGNIAFGLESRGWSASEIKQRVEAMLELVDLAGFGERKVSQISGGQQQRVALARALAPEPRLLLLDEPLSNLDPALRERTREELQRAVRKVGITTVLVTHEQEEAFHLGDRVAVLNAGRLEQVGRPRELYRRPASRFVASFVGRSSAVPGTVDQTDDDGITWVFIDAGRDDVKGATCWAGRAVETVEPGARVDLLVRPESMVLAPTDRPGRITGRVVDRRFLGALTYAGIELIDGSRVWVEDDGDAPASHGEDVYIAPRGAGPRSTIFPAVDGQAAAAHTAASEDSAA